ncbi:GNAT family N-acetyltransferase [Nocardia grenadensis]|uniref:GNAT family N-acetyltransferase n=1 Tax=Nocardia grenadensis TaxID=931537 RepID=UPI0007A562A7|nr:GNAT family N-acetyltransferase [Nocardia grenadensis]
MDPHHVTLRKMTPAQFRAATTHREIESVRELAKFMSENSAREKVRAGAELYLPDGPDTQGHQLLVAQNTVGQTVGDLWIGPDPREATSTGRSAWLYDIYVFKPFRRLGYGSAILDAAERLVTEQGTTRLGLNVVGDNTAAIALYRSRGYTVSSMYLDKTLPP